MYQIPELGRCYMDAAISHFEYKIAISSNINVIMVKSRLGEYDFRVEKTSDAIIKRFLVTVQGEAIEVNQATFSLNKDSVNFFESDMYNSRSEDTKNKMIRQHSRLNAYMDEVSTLNRKINAAVPEWSDPEDEDVDTPAVVELKERRDSIQESIEKIKNRFLSQSKVETGEFLTIKEAEPLMTEELKKAYLNFFFSMEGASNEEETPEVYEEEEILPVEDVEEEVDESEDSNPEDDSDFSEDVDGDDGQEVITV